MSNHDTEISTRRAILSEETVPPAALPLDMANYRDEVDRFDITEAQKQELLLTLWSIMRSFVELGFTADVCGALFDDAALIPADQELR